MHVTYLGYGSFMKPWTYLKFPAARYHIIKMVTVKSDMLRNFSPASDNCQFTAASLKKPETAIAEWNSEMPVIYTV